MEGPDLPRDVRGRLTGCARKSKGTTESKGLLMNLAKADFFDTMANAPWAVEAYRAEDRPEIDRFMAKAEIRPGAWALEPGCGAGRLTEILADAVGPDGLAVALDISPKMVAACRARVGHCGNVRVHHAAVEDFEIEPATFDAVVCHHAFPHLAGKLVPTPREFSSDCGIALCFNWSQVEQVRASMESARVEIAGMHPL